MKTIKFRGKRLIDGKWIFGCLADYSMTVLNAPIEKKVIFENIVNFATDNFRFVVNDCAVDPVTIGQFTGLFDANGTEIYEGDVLLSPLGHVVIVKFGYKEHVVKHDIYTDSYASYGWIVENVDNKQTDFLDNEFLRGKVIGNIHDNPELMKGGCHE